MHQVVVQHDVGRREAFEAAHGDQAGIARPCADEIHDAPVHGCSDPARRLTRAAPPRGYHVGALGSELRAATRAPERRRLGPAARAPCARTARLPSSETTAATSSSCRRPPAFGQRANRRLAAAAERFDQRPLGRRAPPTRRGRRCARHAAARRVVVFADLDGDDALARRGHAGARREARTRCATANPSRRSPAAASTSAS